MAQFSPEQEYEDPNAGVETSQHPYAGPGLGDKILAKYSDVKQKFTSPSTPSAQSTPSGVEMEANPSQESKVDDFNDSPRGVENGNVSRPPSRPPPSFSEENSSIDQSHNDAVSLDTTEALRRDGYGVEKSPISDASAGSSGYVDSGASQAGSASSYQEGTAARPAIPKKDFAERIMDKLPGFHTNPYSVGNPSPTQQAGESYAVNDQSAAQASPSFQSRGPESPGLLSKLKNLVTGQKATQGTATDNATAATAEREPLVNGYGEEQTREEFGGKGPDDGSAEAWPSPGMSNIPAATRTDAEGRPIEGPTQPYSEDTKKDGLMTKLMDKLHLHGPNSPPSATATPATTASRTTNNTVRPSTTKRSMMHDPGLGIGMPTYSEHVPDSGNSEGQATGPVEA